MKKILNKLTLVVVVTAGWLLSSAAVLAQDTNAPKTKLEAFEAQTGIMLIKGTASLGAVPAQAGTVLVRYKESTDAHSGLKMHGVAIEVKEGDQKEDTTIVDYDELDAFLGAIDYVGKVDYTVTTLPAFEAVYTTRGGLRIAAYSNRRSEGIQIAVQSNNLTTTRAQLSREQLAQFQLLVQQAKSKLDVLHSQK